MAFFHCFHVIFSLYCRNPTRWFQFHIIFSLTQEPFFAHQAFDTRFEMVSRKFSLSKSWSLATRFVRKVDFSEIFCLPSLDNASRMVKRSHSHWLGICLCKIVWNHRFSSFGRVASFGTLTFSFVTRETSDFEADSEVILYTVKRQISRQSLWISRQIQRLFFSPKNVGFWGRSEGCVVHRRCDGRLEGSESLWLAKSSLLTVKLHFYKGFLHKFMF